MNEDIFILLILCISPHHHFFYLYFHLYIVYKCTRKSTGENKAKQNIKQSIQAKRLCIGQRCTCVGEVLPLCSMDLLSWRSYRWRIERLTKSSTPFKEGLKHPLFCSENLYSQNSSFNYNGLLNVMKTHLGYFNFELWKLVLLK